MPAPREIIDALESVIGIYFSGIRHRERAAFLLCDEMVEMCCKLRARHHDYLFNMKCGFHAAWNAPGVGIPANPLGNAIHASRDTRNNMQHASAAATVDAQHCADAIMDAVSVLDHCWSNAATTQLSPWLKCALRVVHLYSSQADSTLRQPFEDMMRDSEWHAGHSEPKKNEITIRPGLREFWPLLMVHNLAEVEDILNSLGVP